MREIITREPTEALIFCGDECVAVIIHVKNDKTHSTVLNTDQAEQLEKHLRNWRMNIYHEPMANNHSGIGLQQRKRRIYSNGIH